MKKLSLIIMAAGIGRRYGGLKQVDPVGPNGELIIDYSLFDARRAGIENVVFIIRRDLKDIFLEKSVSGPKGTSALIMFYRTWIRPCLRVSRFLKTGSSPGGPARPSFSVVVWFREISW